MYCVPDRFQILTHSSMTMEPRANFVDVDELSVQGRTMNIGLSFSFVHFVLPFRFSRTWSSLLFLLAPVLLGKGEQCIPIMFQVLTFRTPFQRWNRCSSLWAPKTPCAIRTSSRLHLLGAFLVPPTCFVPSFSATVNLLRFSFSAGCHRQVSSGLYYPRCF